MSQLTRLSKPAWTKALDKVKHMCPGGILAGKGVVVRVEGTHGDYHKVLEAYWDSSWGSKTIVESVRRHT